MATYTKNLDGTFTEVVNPLSTAQSWVAARAGETSTLLGAVGITALAPTIVDNLTQAALGFAAGNYVAMLSHVIPAVVGIYGALAAIITPDKKGSTDAEIHTAVSAMSREQLIQLLNSTPDHLQPTHTSV